MKNRVKLSESQLRAIIAESCEKVLNEIGDTPAGQWMLARLDKRQEERDKGYHPGGAIKKTTIPVRDYWKNYRDDDENYSAAYNGRRYEDDNISGTWGEYRCGEPDWNEHSAGYGCAMKDMIRNYRRSKGIED